MRALGVQLALLLLLPPLLLGVINKTKAWFAGRMGPPLVQPYLDLWRQLRKGAVYSTTSTWMFRAGPIVALASTVCAGLVLPLASGRAPLGFAGDVFLFAGFLAVGRFFTMAAALDTGSSFEGMGASREAAFSALGEPALLLALSIACVAAQSVSFAEVFAAIEGPAGDAARPVLALAALALFAVLLAENSRIPVDDPNTHLELTMIHEVMVLDHSGPDFGFVLYGGAMKLFVLSALVVHVVVPVGDGGSASVAALGAGSLAVAVLVGIVESATARLRLPRIPQFLAGACVLGAVGLAVLFYGGPGR